MSCPMAHQMGLLKGEIPAAATADNVIVYDGNTYDVNATGEKWTRVTAECTSATWNASTTFTSSTNKPYHDTTNKILYYVAKTEDATISISATAGTQLYAWSVSGSSTTVNTKNICKSFTIATPDYSNAFNQKIWKFSYSGEGKQFNVPQTGNYKIECWGASGGGCTTSPTSLGGRGAYVAGTILLNQDEDMYIHVGQQGDVINTAINEYVIKDIIYNNGGRTYGRIGGWIFCGGGATDVRFASGTWNDPSGLQQRIIVAGAGGGAITYHVSQNGGCAGGLTGYDGSLSGSDAIVATGGEQTRGGLNGRGSNIAMAERAGFGVVTYYSPISDGSSGQMGGGGSGWYCGGTGGHGSGTTGTGAGGSSYLSGYSGCPSHALGRSFISGTMIMKDGKKTFLSPSGISETGHSGNGYVRISYINQ